MPHVAEEFWERLGEKKKYAASVQLVVTASFPAADEKQINASLEIGEQHLQDVIEDVRHIMQLLKRERAASITFIVHAPWKMKVRALVAQHKNIKLVMEEAKKDPELAGRMPLVSALASKLLKNIGSLIGDAMEAEEEKEVLEEAAGFLAKEFGAAEVVVLAEKDAPAELAAKAANALPGKPSIIIA